MSLFNLRLISIFFLVVAGLLQGCGFRFSGDVDYPPEMAITYISTSDRYSPFYRALTKSLDRDGITVTDNAVIANTIIKIHEDLTGQRVLSVSARNVPREYDIYYIVRYSVLVKGHEVLPEQTLTLTQDYTYDELQVLGKDNEAQILRSAIAENMVDLIARQIKTGIDFEGTAFGSE